MALTAADAQTFERCIAVGGIAVFPADTVYGLACEPDSKEAVQRLYMLKRRLPDKPAAVMFFALELALAARPRRRPRSPSTQHARLQPLGTQLAIDESMKHEDGNGVSHKRAKQPRHGA